MPAKKRKYIRRRKVESIQLVARSTDVGVYVTSYNREGVHKAKMYFHITNASIDRILALAKARRERS